jgi:hypothetical protein
MNEYGIKGNRLAWNAFSTQIHMDECHLCVGIHLSISRMQLDNAQAVPVHKYHTIMAY